MESAHNICRICGTTENMYKWKKGWCHNCMRKHKNELERKRYHADIEKSRERKRLDAMSEKQQEYRKKYKQTAANYKEWCKQYAQSTQVAIRGTLSTRIRTLLARKHKSTTEYLGCSVQYFMKWLESQFDANMNWDNYGTYWVIDHVKPCHAYDLTDKEQASECFHWKNMRPLEKTENADVIAKHSIIANTYEYENAYDI